MGISFNPQHTHPGKLDMKSPPPPRGYAYVSVCVLGGGGGGVQVA